MKFLDGIRNALTGLGGSNDPGAANNYVLQHLTDQELIVMYNSSWLARQVVDIPANDATKKWRRWEGDDADVAEEVAEFEAELGVQAKINLAMSRARLLGGAAVIIGAGSPDAAEELVVDQVTEIEYLTVLDRIDLISDTEERDVTSPRFGLPKGYSTRVDGRNRPIHPSRLILFNGMDAGSRLNLHNLQGWGFSRLQPCADAIKGYDSAMTSLKTLMHQAKTDVISIKDLTSRIADPNFEKNLKARLAIIEATVGNHRKLIMDTEEEYTNSSYTFGGVADSIKQFAVNVSGASDIPMTRLFGQSPGGMNSTGDSDLTNYYDNVAAIQKNEVSPAMRLFDQVLLKAAGVQDDSVKPKWNPIKEMTEKEQAEIFGKKADAFSKVVSTQVFDDGDLAEAGAQLFATAGLEGLQASEEGEE